MADKSRVPYPDTRTLLKGNGDRVETLMREEKHPMPIEKIEYVAFKGCLIYIEGATHPKKGFPTPEAIWAVNQVKVVFIELTKILTKPMFILGFLFTWNKKKLLESLVHSFLIIGNKALDPYLFKDIFLTPTAYKLNDIILVFLNKLGIRQGLASEFAYTFCHLIEYDDAYRYRIQDIASETSTGLIKENPRAEIKRLIKIFNEREISKYVREKFLRIANIMLWMLLIPRVKKAFVEAISGRIEGVYYDEADWYWVSLRSDYNFGGMTFSERVRRVTPPPCLLQES